MDALSEIVASLDVRGSLFSRAELSAPWAVRTEGTATAIFHVVVGGRGCVRTDDGQVVSWGPGAIVMLPHGHAHVMATAPDIPPISIARAPSEPGGDGLRVVRHGGGGDPTSLLCGTFRFRDEARDFLLPLLPPVLCVKADAVPIAAWLDQTVRVLRSDLHGNRAGSELVGARLADLIFLQVLRAWSERERGAPGWLSALSDPSLARVLDALHAHPDRSWSGTALARIAGMSRTSFFARFTAAVGEPPASYLTRWRMVLARRALREERVSIAQVAERVGYASEAAFSRAFKRWVGESPGAWRTRLAA